jgi:DNA-binding NarL/FixJ family response regulator
MQLPPSSMPLSRAARFLLVDPSPISRAQLRTRLRALHPKWEIFVAGDAAQALAVLDRVNIDVIVSELCGDGFDGAELLGEVATRWPTTARLAHTSGRGSCRFAHRRLAKPADDTALFVAVKTALRLHVELERHESRITGVRRMLRS